MATIPTNIYKEIFPDLNISEIDVVEDAAGPGLRLVVWLQGCLKRCAGCANAPFLPQKIERIMSVERLLSLLERNDNVSGITLSGGEPMLQAEALTPFLKEARRRGLTVVCYTGYTLKELTREENELVLADFLSQIDLLIDGEYRRDLPRAGAYRPSSNQQLHYLSGRIPMPSQEPTVETIFTISNGQAVATGTLPADIRRRVFEMLRARGVEVKPLS